MDYQGIIKIGTGVSLLTLVVGFLLLPFLTMILLWLLFGAATALLATLWDAHVARHHQNPMSAWTIVLLALNWPCTWTIWFALAAR